MRLHTCAGSVILTFLLIALTCDNAGADSAKESQVPIGVVSDKPSDEALEGLERGARQVYLTGDLDAILERGYIRVLAPFSKTYLFYEGARPRGLAYEFMEEFAKSLRKRGGKAKNLTVTYRPMARDRMIPAIAEGLGDIAIGGFRATEKRQEIVEIVTHPSHTLSEIVVTGPEAPHLESVDDLSGHRVFVRRSSSYFESLQKLNKKLASAGKRPVKIVEADENLEVDDILELIRSGVEHITVVDDFLAHFWSDVMGALTVRDDLVLVEGAEYGPVVRNQSPQLVEAVSAFQGSHGIGTLFGNVVINRYLQDNPWVRNPNASADRKRFERTIPIFRKYAGQYEFDELLLVAQGYQESKLDQSTRSRGGAVGVMQIKPSTAAGDPIKINAVESSVENNIHAGVKYLRHLADDYFGDAGMTPFNRHVFAIAAYNAGPARIQSLRAEAEKEGLDPNVWFNNVELVSARTVGPENVDYVRNILKFWVAYRLAADFDKSELTADN